MMIKLLADLTLTLKYTSSFGFDPMAPDETLEVFRDGIRPRQLEAVTLIIFHHVLI